MVTKKRDSTSETLEDIWLAVEEDCISILDVSKMVRILLGLLWYSHS